MAILETLELCSELLPRLVAITGTREVAVMAVGKEGEVKQLPISSQLRSGAELRQYFHARVSQATLYPVHSLNLVIRSTVCVFLPPPLFFFIANKQANGQQLAKASC